MKVHPFYIQIRVGRDLSRLKVSQISIGLGFERFEVKARNGFLLFESNRPLLSKKGLLKRKPELKLIQGKLTQPNLIEDITEAILRHIWDR